MCSTCVNANNYVVCSINIQDSAESEGCEFYQLKTQPCESGNDIATQYADDWQDNYCLTTAVRKWLDEMKRKQI